MYDFACVPSSVRPILIKPCMEDVHKILLSPV